MNAVRGGKGVSKISEIASLLFGIPSTGSVCPESAFRQLRHHEENEECIVIRTVGWFSPAFLTSHLLTFILLELSWAGCVVGAAGQMQHGVRCGASLRTSRVPGPECLSGSAAFLDQVYEDSITRVCIMRALT